MRIINFADGFTADTVPPVDVPASSVAVTPTGNLTSTNVQAALVELQGDSDAATAHIAAITGVHGVTGSVVGTGGAQTLTAKTIVVSANTITTAAAGNLAATELNSALNELQLDIDTRATSVDLGTLQSLIEGEIGSVQTDVDTHEADTANPHLVTATQVGLGNVDNTSNATERAATATLTNKTLTAPVINSPTGIVKADVGLGNVDNTSDATKNTAAVTLTNKTINGASNTLTVLAATQLSGAAPIANGGTGQTAKTAAFDALSPVTTKGDLIARGASNNVRVAVGADGQVLISDSTAAAGVSWSAGSSGAGEINSVINPSAASATTGYAAGTSHSVARDTTNSPLNPVIATSLALTATANVTESSSSGIGYTISTFPSGLQNRKNKVEFWISTSSADTWALSVYAAGTTRVALSTDSAGVTTIPAGVTGKFSTSFDADNSTSYTVRFSRTAGTGTSTAYMTSLVVGPGIQPQGAVVGPWTSFTPTGSWTTNTTYTGLYRRVGDTMEVQTQITLAGAPNNASLTINIPLGLTLDTTRIPSQTGTAQFGPVSVYDDSGGSGTSRIMGYVHYNGTTSVTLYSLATLAATDHYTRQVAQTSPITFAVNDRVMATFTVPIAEWAGSGTVNLSQNDVDFAADDGTNDVFGPQGALVPNVAASTGTTTLAFNFPTAKQESDLYIPEINYRGQGWTVAASLFPYSQGNNASASNLYGVQAAWTAATTYSVFFGNQGTQVSVSNASAGATSWATERTNGTRFRVRKVAGGSAVGFGLATTTSAGLVNPYSSNGVVYSGKYTPTVSYTNCTASSIGQHNYIRVGKTVFVSGSVTVTLTTTAIDTFVTISLPVTTAVFTTIEQASGAGIAVRASANTKDPVEIRSNIGLTTVDVALDGASTASGTGMRFSYSFSYEIQ